MQPALVAGGVLGVGRAQVRTEPTGSVAGRVLCGDTNDPARSARVHLEPVRAAGGEKKVVMGETGPPSGVEGVTLQTDLNGEFLFPKVLPGGYFVIVEMPGYLSARAMFTDKEIEDPSPEMRQLVGRALNRVQVETGHTERVQVRMERGSAVSGTVHFDDGSPAIGVPVKLLKKGDKGVGRR